MYGNKELFDHARANDCKDPDCELHHLDVSISENTIGYTEAAFFYAGACAAIDLVRGYLDDSTHDGETIDETDLDAALAELRDQHALNGR